MKIYSYNVNGIRAAIKKGLIEWLREANPDILCIQEMKASPEQFDTKLFHDLGYHDYWMPAEKKGYSGVGVLSKVVPKKVTAGIGIGKYDLEGRVLQADYEDFSLLSTYFPSGTTGDIRQEFKMQFLEDFAKFVLQIRRSNPHLVIAGDYNICHKPIDINHPERHKKSSGFLPEERAWFDQFVDSGMVDSFRIFNAEPNQYSWWSYRANSRAKNLGWRIDYHLVSNELSGKIKDAGIEPNAMHSDHCPVWVTLDL